MLLASSSNHCTYTKSSLVDSGEERGAGVYRLPRFERTCSLFCQTRSGRSFGSTNKERIQNRTRSLFVDPNECSERVRQNNERVRSNIDCNQETIVNNYKPVSKCITDNTSVPVFKAFTTDCSPRSVVKDFQSSFVPQRTSYQPDI